MRILQFGVFTILRIMSCFAMWWQKRMKWMLHRVVCWALNFEKKKNKKSKWQDNFQILDSLWNFMELFSFKYFIINLFLRDKNVHRELSIVCGGPNTCNVMITFRVCFPYRHTFVPADIMTSIFAVQALFADSRWILQICSLVRLLVIYIHPCSSVPRYVTYSSREL